MRSGERRKEQCVWVCAPPPAWGAGVGREPSPYLFICSSLFGTQSPRVAVTPALACAENSLYEWARVRVCSKLAPYERSKGSHRASYFPPPLAATCLSFCLKTIKPKLFFLFISFVCAQHISQSLVLQLSTPLWGDFFVMNPSNGFPRKLLIRLNCPESWMKEKVRLRLI